MSRNVLLISDQQIIERTSVHGNIDPQLLYPEIKAAQDMYLLPILGTALFDKLQQDIVDGVSSGNYYDLRINYIIDALMWYVLSELPMNINYQFWNKGVLRSTSDSSETLTMTEIISISDRYRKRAEHYGERLKKYLIEKAATMFPEYLNPGNGVDTVLPHGSTFQMPIYLGGMKKKDCGGHEREYLSNCE